MKPSGMRLLFAITCFKSVNTGNGGHYHSVKTIAEAYARAFPEAHVEIVSFGDFEPPALKSSPLFRGHINVGLGDVLFGAGKAVRVFDETAVTHVHAFDRKAVFFAQTIARRCGAKLYVTKPGGPNVSWFPRCEDIILFSHENLNHFRKNPRFKGVRLHLAPNRIRPPKLSEARAVELRAKYGLGDRVLLRICRIGDYYWNSIRQTLNLGRALRSAGVEVQTVILGTVEQQEVLERLQADQQDKEIIVTNPSFTTDAAELLDVARIVVGTGRSAMEAVAAGKTLLAPVAGADLPELVTLKNVDTFFEYNFSERTVLQAEPLKETLGVLALRLSGASSRTNPEAAELGALFDVDVAMPQYAQIYAAPQVGGLDLLDRAVLWLGTVESLVRTRG